jgi:hypothetical protein
MDLEEKHHTMHLNLMYFFQCLQFTVPSIEIGIFTNTDVKQRRRHLLKIIRAL